MLLVSYWLAVTVLCFLSQASSKNIHEYQLRAKLFTNYSKLVPPQPINTPVNVSLNIAFASLKNMDVKKEEISINIWQRQYWYDDRLSWNSSKNANITQMTHFLKDIWTPDIYLYYSSGNVNRFGKDIPGSLPFSAIAYSSGLLFFSQPATIYAPCEVDVGFYPFDDQICKVTFGTWSQDVSVVRMLLYKGGFDTANYNEHNEWEIVSIKPSRQTVQLKPFKNGHHATVVYTIHLRRHALFYMINYILPSIIIAILSLLLFLIPPEVGKRMEAGINLLLCLSVYLMLVNSKMPLSSKNFPLLTKFYGCTIMILVVSLCCSCWVYSYYFMNPSGWDVYHLPAVLEKVIFNCLGPVLNLPCKRIPLQPSSNHNSTDVKGYENQVLDEDQDNGQQLKGAVEASTDQSKNEMITTQRSSSLVDGGVTIQAKEASAESSTDKSKNGMVTTKIRGSLVEETKDAADVSKDQSQNETIPIKRTGGDLREKKPESSTVACGSNQAEEEEAGSSLAVNEAILAVDRREDGDQKQGEESLSVKDACDREDATGLDTSKKKKKKKKKKTSKLVRKTIAVQRAAKSFDQQIKESPRAQDDGDDNGNDSHDNSLQEEENVTDMKQIKDSTNDRQDVGDDNCDNTGYDNNHEEEDKVTLMNQIQDSSRGQDVGDDKSGNFVNLQEEEHAGTETSVRVHTMATALPSNSLSYQNRHLLYLAQSSHQNDQKFENTERWKLAAIILDRLFIILLVLSIVASFLACFLISPRVRKGLI